MATACSAVPVDDIEDFGIENLMRDRTNLENWTGLGGIRYRRNDSVKIHSRNHNRMYDKGEQMYEEKLRDCPEKIDNGGLQELSNEKENMPSFHNDLVPQKFKIFIKTWGCSHNSSDGEYMSGLLMAYGFQITDIQKDADVWILNSCTVKGPAEQHFKNEIESGQKFGKSVIVSGCVPQSDAKNAYIKGLSIIGVQQIDQVVQVVEETLMGNTVRLLSQKKEIREVGNESIAKRKKAGGARLNLPKIRRNALIEIIPISTGCLNSCTYCKTKFARGDLGSYSIDEIVSRAKHVFEIDDVKEIWLTSEDTGAWGIDLGLNIIDLLKELVKVIPEGCMLRIGMTNPPYILDHLEEISKILLHPRVYAFLHIPVQAGSDAVLSDMKREYCIKDFENVVDYLRQRVPGISIATDIICGFPTETVEDFKETLRLVVKYKFPSLFINQFYPRPGTVANKMPRIPTQEVKRRTKELTNLFQSYTPYDSSERVGQRYSILITEVSYDGRFLVGHNKFYEQILVAPPDETALESSKLMGKTIMVEITSTSKHSMVGIPISSGSMVDYSGKLSLLLIFIVLLISTICYRLS